MVNVSSSIPDFTGKVIDNGRLKLLEVIGTGAYGVVYNAFETSSTGRSPRYAVKCLLKDLPPKQRKFQAREIALHTFVSVHPNILTMHGTYEEDHYIYLILDLCPGGDLFGAITERHVYYRNDLLLKKAFLQLLDAVQWCHDHNIFHRDLKPENILCSEDGSRLYLSDFGLATRDTISRDFGCGSSYYMSPECIGKEFDLGAYSTRHSDVWSLGIILTNMITGRNPWRWATTDDECFCAYLHNRDFLLEMLPISRGTNRILRRIFTLNPHTRISIPDLREAVLAVESFWMSKVDITRAGEHVRAADHAYAAKVTTEEALRTVRDDSTLAEELSSSSSDFGGPPKRQDVQRNAFVSTPARVLVGRVSSQSPVAAFPHPVAHPPDSSGSSSDLEDSTSSEESEGPITPDTIANDPAVEVPEMPEGAGMGERVVLARAAREGEAAGGKQHAKSPVTSPSYLLKNAVRRFKALHA
ncbi:kinase-like protein [Neolentinus lepideus HHB14362 ss-1]|uniref:Kinase-like protein n=1 Tax=Neolentinus lepideus HHB14362 ss-1 TaxID=1314782 RepID=A0A165P1Q5_9AGAM|nr:kinase-like protein [Neolentinus lepideus HHB14362 ss-1]